MDRTDVNLTINRATHDALVRQLMSQKGMRKKEAEDFLLNNVYQEMRDTMNLLCDMLMDALEDNFDRFNPANRRIRTVLSKQRKAQTRKSVEHPG